MDENLCGCELVLKKEGVFFVTLLSFYKPICDFADCMKSFDNTTQFGACVCSFPNWNTGLVFVSSILKHVSNNASEQWRRNWLIYLTYLPKSSTTTRT